MTDQSDYQRLRQALLTIATDGDALSGEECQAIAAEALEIPVPSPPVIPQRTAAAPEPLPAPYAHNAPSQADIDNDGMVLYPADMPADSRAFWRR